MLEFGANKVMQVWTNKNQIRTPNIKEELTKIIDKIAISFSAGLYYYFTFDFINYKIENTSHHIKDVLGIAPERYSLEKLFEIMHPEDLDKINEKENISLDFKLNVIEVEDIPHYKTVYPIRIMHADGNYRTILQQSRVIIVSKEGKVQQTIIIHTDISHFNIPTDHTISFISDTRPSYYSVKTSGLNKFVESKLSNIFTSRELDIIQNMAIGKNFKEIAFLLSLSPHTINTHKKNILQKAECKTTSELITKCIKEGII